MVARIMVYCAVEAGTGVNARKSFIGVTGLAKLRSNLGILDEPRRNQDRRRRKWVVDVSGMRNRHWA